jgi:hypothetical protein
MSLPQWLVEKLASPPTAGAGIHAWLFAVARQLHAHMPGPVIEAALTAATAGAARRVTPREIRDAVANSREGAWQAPVAKDAPDLQEAAPKRPASAERWPKAEPGHRASMVAASKRDGAGGLVDLFHLSPVEPPQQSAMQWLNALLPDAEWLCLAAGHPGTARTRSRARWGEADGCGLVVPSPMTGTSGRGLDGRLTHRSLDNTGPRRWLVVEFDSGSLDDQAALHWYLKAVAEALGWPQLRLAVHSGGKSLHGWYGPCQSEEQARELMTEAVRLGADPATWTRCQLVRLPGGVRSAPTAPEAHFPPGWETPGEIRQEVFFFDPFFQCPPPPPPQPILKSSSTTHGALRISMRRPALATAR